MINETLFHEMTSNIYIINHVIAHNIYIPQLTELVNITMYGIFLMCMYITFMCFAFFISFYRKIVECQKVEDDIKSEIPNDHDVMYVVSFQRDGSTDPQRSVILKAVLAVQACLISIAKDTYIFLNSSRFASSKTTKFIFDIDDAEEIVEKIRDSSDQDRSLWIFVDSPGGGLIESDSVCTAIRTYQHIRTKEGAVRKIVCIVNKIAQSAGTMLALSADILYMNPYAVLGPTDPQTVIVHDEDELQVSCQLYNEIDSINKASEFQYITNQNEYLITKNESKMYLDNIATFKTLRQYVRLPNKNKKKMLEMFCENSVPHHKEFTMHDLQKLGMSVYKLTDVQKTVIKKLSHYYDLRDFAF